MIKVIGLVLDSSNAPVPYANVYSSDRSGKIQNNEGTATGENGQYALNSNSAYITVSAVGEGIQTKPINSILNFQLTTGIDLNEVEIIGEKPETIVTTTRRKNNTALYIAAAVAVVAVAVSVYFVFKK